MALQDRLRRVFVDTLELGDGNHAEVDVENLNYRDIPEWDSLGHMTLVAAIEDEFDVQLDTEQVIGLSSFKIAVETLRGLGVDD